MDRQNLVEALVEAKQAGAEIVMNVARLYYDGEHFSGHKKARLISDSITAAAELLAKLQRLEVAR